MPALNELLKELPGYKITDSHFRIGSKIHISDFYYAKRFFQNSFFASRFAYLLAKQIIHDLGPKNNDNKDIQELHNFVSLSKLREEGLTLFGYGVYAELLLTLTEKFLRVHGGFDDDKISHNIIVDERSLSPIKDAPPHKNIIIVVPIASTFSTSIKIERELKGLNKKNVLGVHYNLLHVYSTPQSDELSKTETEFGWTGKKWDKREVHIEAFYDNKEAGKRIQKYFIALPSNWQEIKDCMDCYKASRTIDGDRTIITEDLMAERPLFDTDRTEVNPAMIFEIPKANHPSSNPPQPKFELEPAMIGYGNQPRGSGHFLYTLDTELFLTRNEPRVRAWLQLLITTTDILNGLGELDNILIVSSCHYSNTGFLNMVNEVLFSSSANIIHYDPTFDYIQNFDMIYGHEVYMAKKIVFVDDALKSGKTFSKIEEFIRHTIHLRNQRNGTENDPRIHSCIFLVNKSQPHTLERIMASLKGGRQVYSFASLNLFTSLSHDEDPPLLLEEIKYDKLQRISMLDRMRQHYSTQKFKLNPLRPLHTDIKSDERHLKMLEATHRLYDYFTQINSLPETLSFEDFMTDLRERSRFRGEFRDIQQLESRFEMLEACILKVLTHFPFSQYQPIRKLTFQWVRLLLLEQMDLVIAHIKSGSFRFSEYRDLKFLVRRATLLNSNILISHKCFEMLGELFRPGGLQKISDDIAKWLPETVEQHLGGLLDTDTILETERKIQKNEERKKYAILSIHKFSVFFCAQIKELLWLNESRCIRLEQIIREVEKTNSPGYRRLISMLRVENTVIIHQFCEFLDTIPAWKKLRVSGNVSTIDEDEAAILRVLNRKQVTNHHSYKTLCEYFVQTGQIPAATNGKYDLKKIGSFLLFLCARSYVWHEQEKQSPEQKLEAKTRYLFEVINRIIEYTAFEEDIVRYQGAFLIIKDINGFPHVVYERNRGNVNQLDKNFWHDKQSKLLINMLGLDMERIEEPPGGEDMVQDPSPDVSRTPEFSLQLADDISSDYDDLKTVDEVLDSTLNYFEQETILELAKEHDSWVNLHAEAYADRIIDINSLFVDKTINRFIPLRLSVANKNEKGKEKTKGLAGFYFTAEKEDPGDVPRLQYLSLLKSTLTEFVEHNHRNNMFHEWLLAENQRKMVLLMGHSREMLERLARDDKNRFKDYAQYLGILQAIVELNDNFRETKGQSELKEKLLPLLDFDDETELTEKHVYLLREMAEYLYGSPIIENAVDVNVEVSEGDPFRFKTIPALIKLICFELFINAKKNRWHFSEAENFEGITCNLVRISMWVQEEKGKKYLQLTIENTGPNANKSDDVKRFKGRPFSRIKPDYTISGTAMIQDILRFVFGGKMTIECAEQDDPNTIHYFKVKISIPETA